MLDFLFLMFMAGPEANDPCRDPKYMERLDSLNKNLKSLVKQVQLYKERNPEQWNEAVRRYHESEAKKENDEEQKE